MIRLELKYVNIMHIFIIGACLAYIGYFQNNSPKWIYYLIGLLGLGIIFIVPFPDKDYTIIRNLLYFIHYLLFIPSFLAISYFGIYNKLSKETYILLGFVGLFIITYHSYKLFTRLS